MATKKTRRDRNIGKMDLPFLCFVLILLTVGLVMLFSASYAYSLQYYGNSYKFISKQLMFAIIGVALMLIISLADYHWLRKFAWIVYVITAGLLIFLLIVPPMVSGMDVKRWFVIGPINFQPSEIAKFAIILLFSSLIAANHKLMDKLGFIAFLVALLGGMAVLIILEPHLSATLLLVCIGAVLLIVGGIAKKYLVAGGILGVAAIAVFMLSGAISYVSDRLQYWLDPWSDATGAGYQTIQSLLAIGSGGLLGRGIGQSRQKYLWVPEPHNDFIFSIVCEELGLVGAVIIVLLFCLLIWRGFKIAMHAPDKFGSLMAVGLTFQVGLQAMLNILVVTNTIPNTGISLPFFSYGGSSLMILLCEMGIILSISRQSNIEKG